MTENFVAFIDVLGFSDLVNTDNLDNLETYCSSISEILEQIRIKHRELIKAFLISDSIILMTPYKTDSQNRSLKSLLLVIQGIQKNYL